MQQSPSFAIQVQALQALAQWLPVGGRSVADVAGGVVGSGHFVLQGEEPETLGDREPPPAAQPLAFQGSCFHP